MKRKRGPGRGSQPQPRHEGSKQDYYKPDWNQKLGVGLGDEELKPDLDMAANFLQLIRPGGPWTLVAVKEYDDGRTHKVTQICSTEAMAREFIARWNVDHNIGFALYK
jgi:hypothetical protein